MTKISKTRPEKRIRIHFADHGQDFLWWDLVDAGDDYSYKVVDCGPFQAWFWTQYHVTKQSVRKGRPPVCSADLKTASPLKYRITKIERNVLPQAGVGVRLVARKAVA